MVMLCMCLSVFVFVCGSMRKCITVNLHNATTEGILKSSNIYTSMSNNIFHDSGFFVTKI